MILPSDYDSTKAYDGTGGYTPLPVGGHICRIVGARATKSRNGNDMIEVAFDIAEGSEFDGKFKERFDFLRKSNANAKWPNGGMFRTGVLNSDGKTSGYFKGLITAVEESNPGYSFKGSGCNEETMKGKYVGFNFGEEDYKGNDGKIRTSIKPFYAVSVQTVRDGIEPPKKKEYKPKPGESMAAQGFTQVDDDPELPF
mgnify:CR=1 FL=1